MLWLGSALPPCVGAACSRRKRATRSRTSSSRSAAFERRPAAIRLASRSSPSALNDDASSRYAPMPPVGRRLKPPKPPVGRRVKPPMPPRLLHPSVCPSCHAPSSAGLTQNRNRTSHHATHLTTHIPPRYTSHHADLTRNRNRTSHHRSFSARLTTDRSLHVLCARSPVAAAPQRASVPAITLHLRRHRPAGAGARGPSR